MERTVSRFTLTPPERFLTSLLLAAGWVLILFAVIASLVPVLFNGRTFVLGLLLAATGLTGPMLLLASAGIRQNRIALEMSCFFTALSGMAWVTAGVLGLRMAALVAGVVLIALFVLIMHLRRRSARERFQPRFFTIRQFDTMTQMADTMLETEGDAVLNPIQVAKNVDVLLDEIDSDVKNDIKTVMILTEWVLPLMTFRPFPFSDLGSHARRQVVARVIGAKGIFRDVARTLKLLSCAGYYGSEEGMIQAGYVPFEQRDRSEGVDLTPIEHADPHEPVEVPQ